MLKTHDFSGVRFPFQITIKIDGPGFGYPQRTLAKDIMCKVGLKISEADSGSRINMLLVRESGVLASTEGQPSQQENQQQ
ncbi:hypothetical protein A6P07_19195 [Acidithiobacillus thiooxidans]|uniref:Uncharacterized protein n=1 Tax=Acidithiobacillus thiooxidans TaxID=930 RepID=A0A1C2HVZ2_ACITH|nr:hypothetical protein A6P07_19195 [Acidithiobacillus thiooxidans]